MSVAFLDLRFEGYGLILIASKVFGSIGKQECNFSSQLSREDFKIVCGGKSDKSVKSFENDYGF